MECEEFDYVVDRKRVIQRIPREYTMLPSPDPLYGQDQARWCEECKNNSYYCRCVVDF